MNYEYVMNDGWKGHSVYENLPADITKQYIDKLRRYADVMGEYGAFWNGKLSKLDHCAAIGVSLKGDVIPIFEHESFYYSPLRLDTIPGGDQEVRYGAVTYQNMQINTIEKPIDVGIKDFNCHECGSCLIIMHHIFDAI